MEITPVPHSTPTLSRGRVIGALLVIGPVIVLVFLPTVMGLHRFVVTDTSMEGDADGSISQGSVALARDVPASDLVVGDVITLRPFEDGLPTDGSVTRRIVSIENGFALTQGDNRDAADPWRLDVTDESYPRVVLAVPWIGYPFSGVAGEGGWLVLAATTGIALVLALMTPRRRGRERYRPVRPASSLGVR